MSNFINTIVLPPGLKEFRAKALESRAYYECNAYPWYGFRSWLTEMNGPYPICMPLSEIIIDRQATWLFGKPISFNIPDGEDVELDLKTHWKLNRMDTRLTHAARIGGKEGLVALKFCYDKTAKIPLSFTILSCVDHVRVFRDPHNIECIEMVRIQYPYQGADGKWYWYREEWTDAEEITYKPHPVNTLTTQNRNPYEYSGDSSYPNIDTSSKFVEASRKRNNFGIIPIVVIQNWDEGTGFGDGDMFGLHRIVDRINLAYHLMDKSNQLDVDPPKVFIDLEPKDNDGMDIPAAPGQALDLQSVIDDNDTSKQGKVQMLEMRGNIREAIDKYAAELKNMLFDATGSVFPRQEDITNKGSLTQSVLIQMYAPLLEVIGEKRKSYGDNGINVFLRTIIFGLANMGVEPYKKYKGLKHIYDDKLNLSLTWFDQFMMSEDEKFAKFDRLDRAAKGGYIPVDIAIKKIAQIEEIELTDAQLAELEKTANERIEQENDRGTENNGGGHPAGNDPGGSEDGQKRQQKKGVRVKDAS